MLTANQIKEGLSLVILPRGVDDDVRAFLHLQ